MVGITDHAKSFDWISNYEVRIRRRTPWETKRTKWSAFLQSLPISREGHSVHYACRRRHEKNPPLLSPLLCTKPGVYPVFFLCVFQRSRCESSTQFTTRRIVLRHYYVMRNFIIHWMRVSERYVGRKCVHYVWRERSISDVGYVMSDYYGETVYFYYTRIH